MLRRRDRDCDSMRALYPTQECLSPRVLGSIAEFERDLIRERTEAGLAAARRRGVRFGRPSVLTAEAAARVARLYGSGQPIRAIASLLGVSRGTVHREIAKLRSHDVLGHA